MPTQRQWQIWDLEARAKVDKLVRQWQQDFLGNRDKQKDADKEQSVRGRQRSQENGRAPNY